MDVTWGQLGVMANLALTIAYLAIATSVLVPLARTGQLWKNHLARSTGLIFFSCGVGHLIHVDHAVRNVLDGGWGRSGIDGHLAVWDALTSVIAVTYWNQRRKAGPPEDAALFEDLRRRQRELEAAAQAAVLREELATERALVARQQFARAFDSTPSGMALVGRYGTVARVNDAFAGIMGRSGLGLVGADLWALLGIDPAGTPTEVRVERPDSRPTWVRATVTSLDDGDEAQLVQLEDVTEGREAQLRLNHLAVHDPLTGLPNRLLFHDRATTALHQGARAGTSTACLYVDLDHFKVVNDSLGHPAGDRVLKVVATRLASILRPGDTVARMGGDEFCLLLPGLVDPAEAQLVAERVIATLDGYVDIDGLQVTTGGSVGVAVAGPGEEVTSQTLVRDADTALYGAKRTGRGHQALFDEGMREEAQRRLRVEAELRRGLGDGQIVVSYQPQWSLSKHDVVAVEALVRWMHPTEGELPPCAFLDVAVETGLIVDLGRQVLDQSLRALAGWRALRPDLTVSVNLSARQLNHPRFVAEVDAALLHAGVPASALCLELTESDLTGMGRSALTTLDDLRALGVQLAVDDVGTGQSSLTHLVTLPVDAIKIDKTFVDQVHLPGAERAVVEALLSLARTIGIDVVAEGAETVEQVDVLAHLGCDVIQGYVVSCPVSERGVSGILRHSAAVAPRSWTGAPAVPLGG